MPVITPEQLADAYSVPGVIDYGPDRGTGLLLATGAGLMMSAMDMLPRVRWAVDVGGGRGLDPDWLEACAECTTHLVVAAWFTVTNPGPFARALTRYGPSWRIVSYVMPEPLTFGSTVPSMDRLAEVSAVVDKVITTREKAKERMRSWG